MTKFKPGDRVVLMNSSNLMARIGARATVVGVYDSYLDIIWVRDQLSSTQMDGKYYLNGFGLEPLTPFEVDLYDYIQGELGV